MASLPQGPKMPERPRWPSFRRVDDCVDAPYNGLDDEIAQETLSQTEQRRLTFVRWSLKRNERHFQETLSREDDESHD